MRRDVDGIRKDLQQVERLLADVESQGGMERLLEHLRARRESLAHVLEMAEKTEKTDIDCATCRWHLGGGCCRINLEAECGAGEFEAWEPRPRHIMTGRTPL